MLRQKKKIMVKHAPQADLFSESRDPLDKKRHIYTVSALTRDIKVILENTFAEVWVEGEISNFRPSSAGHFYFSLKDEHALLQGVIFSRQSKEIKFRLEDGLKVVCYGNIEVYPPHGKYQLIIERVEPKGVGSLQLALEQLKQKLEKEGLFSPAHKRPIPYLPSRIGLVTSLQGAAIKDILKVLERRFEDVHIIVKPVRVQGEGAKEDIAQAIEEFNIYNKEVSPEERIDVMIVGRGGGSIEDLWAFNEEIVARAIYASQIPIISAVGHERDVTVADLVADLRAATPSVAAEIVLPNKEELRVRVGELGLDLARLLWDIIGRFAEEICDSLHRLTLGFDHLFEMDISRLQNAYKKLLLLNPRAAMVRYQEKLGEIIRQLDYQSGNLIKLRSLALSNAADRLFSLSPLNILARGYSITFQLPQGTVIKDSSSLKKGDIIRSRVHKGDIVSEVKEVA